MYIHCTQPKDKLDPVRIRYYEEQLKRGARPAMLALNLHVRELFLLDGHHKVRVPHWRKPDVDHILIFKFAARLKPMPISG
jgi:hypothetical protein